MVGDVDGKERVFSAFADVCLPMYAMDCQATVQMTQVFFMIIFELVHFYEQVFTVILKAQSYAFAKCTSNSLSRYPLISSESSKLTAKSPLSRLHTARKNASPFIPGQKTQIRSGNRNQSRNLVYYCVLNLLDHDIVCPIRLFFVANLAGGMRGGIVSRVRLRKVSKRLIIRFTTHCVLRLWCARFWCDTQYLHLLFFAVLEVVDLPINDIFGVSNLVLNNVFLLVRGVPRQIKLPVWLIIAYTYVY